MNQYAQMIRQLKTPEVMKQLTHLYGQRDGMLGSLRPRAIRGCSNATRNWWAPKAVCA